MNGVHSAVPAELLVVEEFCNSTTLLYGTDALATIDGGREWLDRLGWGGTPTIAQLVSLREAREVVRAFLTDRTNLAARSALNRLAQEHCARPHIDDDGQLALTSTAGSGTPVSPVGAVVEALLLHGLTGSGQRLRTCASEECRWVFYDTSRSGTRAWCDMNTCGARSKMRQYRQRQA